MRSNIKVKLFRDSDVNELEKEVNEFLSKHYIAQPELQATRCSNYMMIMVTYID